MIMHAHKFPVSYQRGFSLFPALIFLLVLAVLGLTALNGTAMQEKMVGNSKDADLAFQAAEAALRDGEADIDRNINATTTFSSACTAGLCTPPSTWSPPTSTDISRAINWASGGLTRRYGAYTGTPALGLVAEQPVYVIEKLGSLPVAVGSSVALGISAPPTGGTAYRVTVLATGARPETRVSLQSTYVVRDP